jgi:hypothetical protein
LRTVKDGIARVFHDNMYPLKTKQIEISLQDFLGISLELGITVSDLLVLLSYDLNGWFRSRTLTQASQHTHLSKTEIDVADIVCALVPRATRGRPDVDQCRVN